MSEAMLKNDDLKDLSVEAFLDMNPEEVAAFAGFKKSPWGIYTGNTEVVAEMDEDEGKLNLTVKITDVTVVELIEGVDGEPKEEIKESDIPTELSYNYTLPDRGQNFKTDWNDPILELNDNNPAADFRTAIEMIDGISIQFTNKLSRSKAKKDSANGSVKKGDEVVYQNIAAITLAGV